jgi:ABC-type transporter Mla maintaining outer membrane lipid asymmetry permease subunit MlaE
MVFADPNITRPYELITYTNTVTGGMYGVVVVLAVFIVSFMALKNYKTSAALGASTFITTLLAIMLRLMGALSDTILFLCFFATLGSLCYLIFERKWY